MKSTIIKSFVRVSSGIILLTGLVACSGEKGTTSYPVAKLNPKRIVTSHFNQNLKHRITSEIPGPEASHDLYIAREEGISQPDTRTNFRFPLEPIRNHDLTEPYQNESFLVNQGNAVLLASTNIEPVIIPVATCLPKLKIGNDIRNNPLIQETKTQDEGNTQKSGTEQRDSRNGFGIVSLVTGIVGLVIPYLAPVAIVFGAIGLNKRMRGLAIAGMVLGIITIVYYVLLFMLFISLLM